jgi:CheY-like chemotaxis protein
MDLKMPILNGFEATKLIKKLRPNLPIVAQTAYSTLQDKEQAILVGCIDFISKPIRQESFKRILDKYLIIK